MQCYHICESWHTHANRGKQPTDYFPSARVFLPKASVATNWVIRNLRRIQFVIREEQLCPECGVRLNNFYLWKLLCIFPSLFAKKISTKHDITSTEISYQFLALKVPVLGRNKAADSSTSTDPFSTATKILVLGNLFKFERFAITFERAFCHWG